MKIEIKNEKTLKEISKKMHKKPTKLLDETVEALKHLPPFFEKNARKMTYQNALYDMFTDSRTGMLVNEIMYDNFGKGDYFVEEMNMDFEKMHFWFSLAFVTSERVLNIDHVDVWMEPGWASMEAIRTIKMRYSKKLDKAIQEFREIPEEGIIDIEDVWDNHITLHIELEEEGFVYLPKLKDVNHYFDEAEKILRKYARQK